MAGPSSLLRLLLVAFVVAGCGGGTTPEPVTRETPETPENTPPPAAEQTPAPSAPTPAPASQEAKPTRDDQPVVVDSGGDGEPQSLVEAARAERERRASAGQSTHVINDKTLPKYARQGQITVADP